MKTTYRISAVLVLLIALFAIGCASFSDQMFWTEKFATDTAYAGLKSWKGYYATATNGLAADKAVDLKKANDQIYEASRQFAATVSVAEGLRVAYATNSAVKAQIPAIMATVSAQASNLVWLVNYWKGS